MTEQLIPLMHEPLQPARKNMPEAVYLKLWQLLMTNRPSYLADKIMHCSDRAVTQRDAAVAATFIVWLASSCGKDFTSRADQLRKTSTGDPEAAAIAAWAITNRRVRGVNNNMRTIEHIMGVTERDGPVITQDDLDVIDCLVCWWVTTEGVAFRRVGDIGAEFEQRKRESRIFDPALEPVMDEDLE